MQATPKQTLSALYVILVAAGTANGGYAFLVKSIKPQINAALLSK
jgi:hypothetical protein